MTDIIAFGWSRQSNYGSRSRGKWTRGFSEHREICPSIQKKSTDWPSTVINTRGSSGVIRTGACVRTPGHLQSWLSWESDPWGLHLGRQSLLQYGPLQTGPGAGDGLVPEGNPAWDAPPFHSNSKFIPFHLDSSGHFSSGCFRAALTAIVGASVFFLVLSSYYFPPHILDHNIPSEPVSTDYLKTDLVHTTVFVTYSRYLELTKREIYLLRSFLPL